MANDNHEHPLVRMAIATARGTIENGDPAAIRFLADLLKAFSEYQLGAIEAKKPSSN